MSKKNQRGGKGYVSQKKSKEAKTLHYKKEVAKENARRDAINAGKSQATADRAGARAEKAVTGNKVNNLQEKREINAAARKEATVKKTPQKLSYWERIKQTAKSAVNNVKQTVKSAAGKVKGAASAAAGKVKQVAGAAAGKVKQVANGAKQAVKSAAGKVKGAASSAAGKVKQVASATAGKVKKVANGAKGKVGAAMSKYGPKALKGLKWGSKRIPVVCSVIGVAEAGYYAYKGEWGKACVALGSGIVSNFPPYGTAAGIAMEAGVVAYDMYESHKQEEARRAEFEKGFEPAEAKTKQAQKQQQKTNTNTNTNAQEADSKTQTKTEDEAQHTSSVRDVRQTMHRDQQNRSNADITGAQSQTNQQSDNQQAEQQAQQQQVQQQQAQSEQQQQTFGQQQQQAQQQTQREQDGFNGSSTVSVANKGDEIVVSYGKGQDYTISKEDLKARMGMSSRRAKGTMEKLQGAIAANSNTEGVIDAVSTYVPELKKDGKGTAKVNRNLVDSTVKAIGGSSKATSITIDGKKIKAKDIQASYGCSKKEAKQILKAYGRAIEDGANLDDVLRDIASGKKLDTSNQAPANNNEAMRAMMARRTMRDFS